MANVTIKTRFNFAMANDKQPEQHANTLDTHTHRHTHPHTQADTLTSHVIVITWLTNTQISSSNHRDIDIDNGIK